MAKGNNEVKNALAGIMGTSTQTAKKASQRSQDLKLENLNSKSKVIGIRFPYEDIEKLTNYFKLETGDINLSSQLRKIIYQFMNDKNLL